MRYSTDNYDNDGVLRDGYDYDYQYWVRNYIVQDCGHVGDCSCEAHIYAGTDIRTLIEIT